MSYLAAHRVQRGDELGINVTLRDASLGPGLDWRELDEGRIDCGQLQRSHFEVQPGGNAVLSYLDVVAIAELRAGDVRALTSREADGHSDDGRTREWESPGVAARARLCRGWPDGSEPSLDDELLDLTEAAENLLESMASGAAAHPPLLVRRTVSDAGVRFELSEESAERLAARHAGAWRPHPLSIPHATLEAWEEAGLVSLGGEIMKILTGLEPEEVEELGGIRIHTLRG